MEKSKIDRFIDAFRVAMYSEFEVNEDGVVPKQQYWWRKDCSAGTTSR